MTGTRPDRPLTQWALEQLELPITADAAAARRQFLNRLANEDFAPPPWQHQAIRVLTGQAVVPAAQGQALLADEYRLREEVESFAAEYFSLAPTERRQRWQGLKERSASVPPLAARLRHLERGLDVTPPSDGSVQDRLVAEVCRLYVMPRAARALARARFFNETFVKLDHWDAAALELCDRQRALFMLEPELIDRLLNWQRDHDRRKWRRKRQTASTGSGSSSGFSPYYLIFIVIVCLRVATGGCSSGSALKTWQKSPVTRQSDLDPEVQKILKEIQEGKRLPPNPVTKKS